MSVFWFAWASIDAEAWDSTEYFARLVVSSAISTSTIRPSAARMLVFCWVKALRVESQAGMDPAVLGSKECDILQSLSDYSY